MISVLVNYLGIRRKVEYNSNFSNFMRDAKSKERKKVFLLAAKMATEDQMKLIKKASIK